MSDAGYGGDCLRPVRIPGEVSHFAEIYGARLKKYQAEEIQKAHRKGLRRGVFVTLAVVGLGVALAHVATGGESHQHSNDFTEPNHR